jgi:hypothetical protein
MWIMIIRDVTFVLRYRTILLGGSVQLVTGVRLISDISHDQSRHVIPMVVTLVYRHKVWFEPKAMHDSLSGLSPPIRMTVVLDITWKLRFEIRIENEMARRSKGYRYTYSLYFVNHSQHRHRICWDHSNEDLAQCVSFDAHLCLHVGHFSQSLSYSRQPSMMLHEILD